MANNEFDLEKFVEGFNESYDDNYTLSEWVRRNMDDLINAYQEEKELADMYRGLCR